MREKDKRKGWKEAIGKKGKGEYRNEGNRKVNCTYVCKKHATLIK